MLPDFDTVLGEGSRAEIVVVVRERFNMDGNDPSGCKVGLLDPHHLKYGISLWSFLSFMEEHIQYSNPSSSSHEGND